MNSQTLGMSTSVLEVTHIDTKGLWLFVDNKEHYMPFDQFPWFSDASVKQISNVEKQSQDHLHWPDLDIDLTLDMIDHPENYPLKYK
ncbi:DUF2442 domain-containing protein [Verrucomicrobiota bacterium]